jgi:hypothetical protein
MDSHKDSVIAQMTDMGFDKNLAEKAYARCDIKTVEGLVNYIDSHPNLENEPDVPENPGQQQPQGESPGESISSHVNQEMAAQLVSLGFTKDVAEKALFFTQSASVEAAQQWLEEHKSDPDFLEPLFIVRGPQQSKLSPEEAKKKAKELQAKIREDRAKRDKAAELEGEIARLKSGKNLTQAQRELEELQTKLAMEKLKREREETENAKRKILEEIEKDRRDRGLKPVAHVQKPVREIFPDIVKKMQKIYPDNEIVKICLKTLGIYLSRIY